MFIYYSHSHNALVSCFAPPNVPAIGKKTLRGSPFAKWNDSIARVHKLGCTYQTITDSRIARTDELNRLNWKRWTEKKKNHIVDRWCVAQCIPKFPSAYPKCVYTAAHWLSTTPAYINAPSVSSRVYASVELRWMMKKNIVCLLCAPTLLSLEDRKKLVRGPRFYSEENIYSFGERREWTQHRE